MGVSTNAILFYGIALDEDAELNPKLEDCNGDFEELYAAEKGVKEPDSDYTNETADAYHKYWDEKRRVNQESGCEVGRHCSSEYPMQFVCVTAGKYVAHRGDVMDIPDQLIARPGWDYVLEEYCKILGIPYSKPSWHLVSFWG